MGFIGFRAVWEMFFGLMITLVCYARNSFDLHVNLA